MFTQVRQSRNIVEKTIEDAGHGDVLMREAYGILPYHCPVLGCSRFWQGFRNHRLRDSHVKRHERAEKCPYKDCYFNAWGFSNQKDLAKHISVRHDKGVAGPSWPALKPQSIWKTLEGAIDKNEIKVVRELCLEIDKNTYESRPEGFILRALRKDNFGTVHVLLNHMATSQEILHADKRGQTALHVASVKGEAMIVERLIYEIKRMPWPGRDILDFNKVTASHPMALAATHGHFEVIRAFLTAELVDESTTEQGPAAPLLNAASFGSMQIVTLWIQHFPACLGAKHIETAISRAATKGHESCIRILLEGAHKAALSKPLASALSAGIQPAMEFVLSKRRKRAEKSDVQALMKAVSGGEESEIRRLIELLGVNITYRDSTPLQAAAEAGQQESVRLLLDLGVGVNTRTGHMGTALAAAAAAGNVEIMKILLEKNADPNLLFRSMMDLRAESPQWDDDVTALHIAAQFGRKEAIELLLDVGASISQTTKTGWTALAIACSIGSVELVSLLFDRGAAPAVEWDELEAPLLHRAIRSGQIDVVTMLLDKGSDVLGRGINGDLPIHVAAEQGEERIARLLIERGASATACNDHGGTALHARGLNGGSMDVPALLLLEGADVNARNTDSETPLLKTLKSSFAKFNPDLSYAHFLLDSGANVDVEDADGNTPLHHLVERYHEWAPALDLARRMIERRAEVDARNSWGNTPMHGIRYRFSQNRLTDGCQTAIELASVLLNAGADFDAENDEGETPRKIALGTGDNAFFPSSRALTWTAGKEIARRIQDRMGFL